VINTGDWIDRPSVGIPYLYVATGMELAEALKQRGNVERARQVFDKSKKIAQIVRLDDLVRGAEAEFAAPVTDTGLGAALTKPAPAAPAPKSNAPAAPKKKNP
jgi:hypothetical protein